MKEFNGIKGIRVILVSLVFARSALSAYTLKQMGCKNVMNIDGGWLGWLEAGYPVE